MQRIALAILILAALAALASWLMRGMTSAQPGGTAVARGKEPMQKLSFVLLMCLVLYVAVSGTS